jgi:TonB family protein
MATGKNPKNLKNNKPSPQPPKPKILRVGVIQAGKIIEERLIRKRDNVTIGASPRNTIVVPASTLPRTFTLFELTGNKYALKFGENMDGRVSVNNQVLSLEQVRTQKLAHPKGNLLALPLSEESRGKVLLGEITLLFQFVTPPPIQPRPQLPPSIRGGFLTTVDWVLASTFITIATLHFGFLLYLRTLDFPRKIEPDVIPDRFADYIPEVEKPKALDLSKLSKLGEEKVEKAEKAGPKKGGGGRKRGPAKPCDEACQAARAERRRARLAAQVARMGVLKLLGTKGAGHGATANLIGSGDPGTDVDRAFSGVGGLTVAGRGGAGGAGLRGKGSGGSGKAVGIGDLGARVGGPGSVGTGKMVKERVPKAIVKQRQAEIDGTMNPDATYRILRRGMRCITATYQRSLKRNPKLSGKVSVCLSVNTMGRVASVSMEEDSIGDPMLTAGVKACVKRLRFPPPEGGSAEVCVPFVLQPSQM